MIQININDIIHYSKSLISEFIQNEKEKEFEIILPRIVVVQSHYFNLFTNYYLAGYAGELLATIADEFSFYVPDPESNKPFRFDIVTANREALLETIKFIADGFGILPYEESFRFHEVAAECLIKYNDGEVMAVCGSLFDIANKYLAKEG